MLALQPTTLLTLFSWWWLSGRSGVLNVCATLLVSCDHMLDQLLHEYVDEVDIPAATAAGIHTKIRVFRAKNRFRHPTASGWADALVK